MTLEGGDAAFGTLEFGAAGGFVVDAREGETFVGVVEVVDRDIGFHALQFGISGC